MGRYYITNGTQYIGDNSIVDTPKLAKRFTYGGAQSYFAKTLKSDKKWAYKKYFLSGGRYVLTTSTLYATTNGSVTKDISKAKHFKSPADAENYIKNHRTIIEYLQSPIIVDSDHEFVCRPEIKQFTQEQLDTLGIKKPTPRIKIDKNIRNEVAKKTGNICPICGEPMTDKEMTLDHKVPLSRGGTNDPSNCQMVHEKCNKFKNNYMENEMHSLTSKIERKYIYENPYSVDAVYMLRAYVRGFLKYHDTLSKGGVV